jgi:hypothetical protein
LVNAAKSNRTPVNTAVDVLSDDAIAIANIADVDFPSVAIGAVAVTISGRTLASALHAVAGAARCAIFSADAGVNADIADVEAAVCTTAVVLLKPLDVLLLVCSVSLFARFLLMVSKWSCLLECYGSSFV